MKAARRLPVLLVLAVVLTGCVSVDQASPTCDDSGRNTLVLLAQSVPDAEYVPCIEALPAGWFINDVEIKNGRTRVDLGNDRTNGSMAMTMSFVDTCDTGDAVEVPSDEREARHFEDVDDVTNGYRGTSYYLFEGGCVTLGFNVRGDGWSALVNDAAAAVTLESRAELERYVREYSNGVIEHL